MAARGISAAGTMAKIEIKKFLFNAKLSSKPYFRNQAASGSLPRDRRCDWNAVPS